VSNKSKCFKLRSGGKGWAYIEENNSFIRRFTLKVNVLVRIRKLVFMSIDLNLPFGTTKREVCIGLLVTTETLYSEI